MSAHNQKLSSIRILLDSNRWNPGTLEVLNDDDETIATFECRGKADNQRAKKAGNEDRDPTLPYGDTPAGEYAVTEIVTFAEPHPRLGAAWIPIEGVDGDADEAARKGRTGLGIHAGRGENLIPTYGCIRMKQSEFDELVRLAEGRRFPIKIINV